MDPSIHDVMHDLVAADAARMSGRDFADARGAGLARKVRTRRTVRAAGVGGASAVALGALAFGAAHSPWGVFDAAPGIGGTDCVTSSASGDAYVYEVLVRKGRTPVDTVSLVDTATGAAFLTATLQPDGTYVFTDADGKPLRSTVDGVYELLDHRSAGSGRGMGCGASWHAEILVKSVSTVDFAGLPSAVASALNVCHAQGGTPTPSSSVVRPSTDPSLAASTETVTSPFQCGFVFDKEASDAPHLTVSGTAWTTPRGQAMSAGDNGVDTPWSAVATDQSLSAVHGVVRVTVGSDQPGYDSLMWG